MVPETDGASGTTAKNGWTGHGPPTGSPPHYPPRFTLRVFLSLTGSRRHSENVGDWPIDS